MPLSNAGMAAAIKAKLLTGKGEAAQDDAELDILCDAIGAAVVEYIVANAVVPIGIAVATTGSESAQTGTTTSTGSIT